MGNIILSIFLAAHGLVHLSYAAPAPDERYPFDFNKSWLITSFGVDSSTVRILGYLLITLTVIGFVLSALATAGLIVPQTWWQPVTVVSAALSLVVLVLFWHSWLVFGILIDVAILAGLLWLHWQPFGTVTT